MPVLSNKSKTLNDLFHIIQMMILDDEDESQEFEELIDLFIGMLSYRYLNEREKIPKSDAMRLMLGDFPDAEFRQIVRMDKASFVEVNRMIRNHPIFQNESRNKQQPVWIQLMVTLNRLGCDGNGASVGRTARSCGVSYGSVCKYTKRVFTALLSLQKLEVKWPDAAERVSISERFGQEHGIWGGVGVIDGTPAHIFQRPHVDGETFFTRKQRYSMNVQLICDDRRRIRYYYLGWPGSVYDNTVIEKSHMYLHPELYFSPGEFLLADSGYALLPFVCTPYRQPAASIPFNEVFNELHFVCCRTINPYAQRKNNQLGFFSQ